MLVQDEFPPKKNNKIIIIITASLLDATLSCSFRNPSGKGLETMFPTTSHKSVADKPLSEASTKLGP